MSKSLLPGNSTKLERDLEQTQSLATNLKTPLRELWNPNTCPVRLLPWLAWALAVDVWDPDWPEQIKRARIRDAVKIHRRKGTVQSVRDAVTSFGSGLALREWFQMDPPGDPYTFQITLVPSAGVPNQVQFQNQIMKAIEQTMPVRCHYTFILGLTGEASIGTLAAAQAITYRRLNLAG